jgi:hypothetical protein
MASGFDRLVASRASAPTLPPRNSPHRQRKDLRKKQNFYSDPFMYQDPATVIAGFKKKFPDIDPNLIKPNFRRAPRYKKRP